MSNDVSNSLFGKALVFGIIVLFLLTSSMSPVYAGITISELKEIEPETAETTNIDIGNPRDRESFLDRYDSSEIEEYFHGHSDFNPYIRHNPIRKPTVIDGEGWDIIVPDDYPTIQRAIGNAGNGYRIFVRSGIYYENVKIRCDSSLTLHGEDKESTIIDASYYGDVIIIEGSATGINISGFTIKNSGSSFAGINISSHYNIINDNIFIGNDHGIKLHFSSGNQILDNEIKDNSKDGILLHRSYANNITGNVITGNGNNGIEFTYSSLGTILDNNEISNHNENGVYLDESSLGNMFTRCAIKENNYGVLCVGVSDGNIFHHNAFIQNNLHVFDSSLDAWDYNGLGNYWDDYDGVDDDGDGIGDTPYAISGGENKDRFPLMNPTMMHEDCEQKVEKKAKGDSGCSLASTKASSNNGWDIIVPDEYDSIQTAVDHANPGDRLFVRSGIYHENVKITIPSITLHGENKETTVIDGGGNDHVVFVNDVADGFNISGFSIQSKEKHFTGLYLYSDSTVVEDIIFNDCNIGLALRDNTDNIVRDCIFEENNYGIWTWMCTRSSFTENDIKNNVLDGMTLQWSNNIGITGSDIENNLFDGILEISCSEFELYNNSVNGNIEFGIQVFNSGYDKIENNIIKNNFNNGLSFHNSNNEKIINNSILSNGNIGIGISLRYNSNDNEINHNSIYWHYLGIFFDMSHRNKIFNNHIIFNVYSGIFSKNSNENKIIDNELACPHYYNYWITTSPGSIIFLENSFNNIISGNSIKTDPPDFFCDIYNGINLIHSSGNKIKGNEILDNNVGINQSQFCENNIFYYNNFIDNNYQAYFENSFHSKWLNNYWDDWSWMLPRHIQGKIHLNNIEIPWVNFDWHPAREPYDIGG